MERLMEALGTSYVPLCTRLVSCWILAARSADRLLRILEVPEMEVLSRASATFRSAPREPAVTAGSPGPLMDEFGMDESSCSLMFALVFYIRCEKPWTPRTERARRKRPSALR
jgi:hypothetical protein